MGCVVENGWSCFLFGYGVCCFLGVLALLAEEGELVMYLMCVDVC